MKPFVLKVVKDENNRFPKSGRIRNGADAAAYLDACVFDKEALWREQAWMLTVDRNGNANGVFMLSLGSTESTDFDKKLVVKAALDTMCWGVIVAHNHPSGDVRPSTADIDKTRQLKRVLDVFDIKLLDHVILGEKKYFSFSDEVEGNIPRFMKTS